MKTKTFLNRTKQCNRGSTAYQKVFNLMLGTRKNAMSGISLVHNVKRGRYSHYVSHEMAVKWIMIELGLKEGVDYEIFNDAPRGGVIGDKIRLTSYGCNKLVLD